MEAVGHIASNMFPSLGPVLMISMGYIDLGKWVTAVESGARFGYDLVLLVIFFNLIAIFCQYLATCVGMATRKNLAQICSEEYCRSACKVLGVQAVVSMITSELTMILGIAHGINLLVGLDLWPSICLATAGAVFMPFLTLMGKWLDETIYISIAGFSLLSYVLGVLISQPEIPIVKDVIFPKLSRESSYLLMALLGANVMAHNFYIHSSIVQQRKLPTASMGALFHDHFFAIMFIFTSIFLVNYVLMNSAAALFRRTDVMFSFQDVSSLMDQVFWTPIAPIAIFVVLLFSSQISSLTWSVGGQLILQYLFGANLSSCINQLFVKVLSIILALCCAKCVGPEGIYQFLIFGQIVQAMLLPSSVIPLFRVASSRLLMGSFKLSFYMEILSLLAFFGMLAANVIFITEMLLGRSSWVNNLGGTMGITTTIPYAVLLLLACISVVSTLYLAVTPMKSASNVPEREIWSSCSQMYGYELPEVREVTDQDKISHEDQVATMGPALHNSAENFHDKSVIEAKPQSCTTADPEDEFHQYAQVPSGAACCTTPVYHPIEAKSIIQVDLEVVDKMSADNLSDPKVLKGVERKELVQRDIPSGADYTDKYHEGSSEFEESLKKPIPANKSENLVPIRYIIRKGLDGESMSLSKLSGLGRASRRQLAAILDEFWGYLFDFHGKLAQEAIVKKFDVLLGIDAKTLGSSVKVDPGTESSKNFFNDSYEATKFPANSMGYSSHNGRSFSTLEFASGAKMERASWSHGLQHSNTHLQRPSSSLYESVRRPCSSLLMPYYPDNRDYQPATIHGYQLASYTKGMGAGRNPYSLFASVDRPPTIKSAAPFVPDLRDSVLYAHRQTGLHSVGSSCLQSPTASRASRLQVEAPYCDHSLIKPIGIVGSSAKEKKYHSSPDISAIIAASRNAMKGGNPIGPKPSLSQMTSEPSQYLNTLSRNAFPLSFDEISPTKLHEDVFSVQSNMNKDTKSLWSIQPFEQLFGQVNRGQRREAISTSDKPRIAAREMFSYSGSESRLLQSLRICIWKLLNLEGLDWLFRQNGGSDEELINKVVLSEKNKGEPGANEIDQAYSNVIQSLSSIRKPVSVQGKEETDFVFPLAVPNCGDDCVWRAPLVVSFGVWCVRRILELSLVESRPELWGKYTYVLNRLQGILDTAFLKPRHPLATCSCLEDQSKDTRTSNSSMKNMSYKVGKPVKGSFTTAGTILEIIKDVESAIAGRKGRTGTAAGDIAFPKGKENLASVLKRYKRRLS